MRSELHALSMDSSRMNVARSVNPLWLVPRFLPVVVIGLHLQARPNEQKLNRINLLNYRGAQNQLIHAFGSPAGLPNTGDAV